MAKVIIEFDTNDKSLKATVDGKLEANVAYIEFYQSGRNEFSMRLSRMTEDEDNKIYRHESIVASVDKLLRANADDV